MQAVFFTGGKQYNVKENQVLKIEKLDDSLCKKGSEIIFDKILLLVDDIGSVKVGQPYIKEAKIYAEFLKNGRGKKINILKFKRRKHSAKHIGHRQYFTELKIKKIQKSNQELAT